MHCAAVFLFLLSACSGNKPPENWQLVSNTHGEIEKIIIRSFPPENYLLKYHKGLIQAMPPGKVNGIIYTVPAKDETTGWLQDVCVAMQKTGGQIKLIYSDAYAPHKATVEELMLHFPNLDTTQTHYHSFDGGNMISSENYMLVGENILHDNKDIPPAELEQQFKTLFSTPHIIFAGMGCGIRLPHRFDCDEFDRYQPLFHIDMFLTPAGTRNGKNLIMLGKIDTTLYRPGYLDQRRKDIISQLNRLIEQTATNIKSKYNPSDTSGNRLADFEFITLPLFILFGEEQGMYGDYYCTLKYPGFNNAIIEITQKNSTVWLPDYADSNLIYINRAKQIAKATYRSAGFNKVVFVSPPADSLGDGALHCITKVLWREKY